MPQRKGHMTPSAPDTGLLVVPPEDSAREARRQEHERHSYALARIAKKMITDGYNREHPRHRGAAPDGVCHCGEPLFTETNGIYKNEKGDYYFDHMNCNSYACPTCAPRRDSLRQREIEEAILAAHEAGHKMLFLTFTIPHWSRDTCLKTRRTIQDAYTKMSRRSRLRRQLDEHGYVHQIKCWDFTYGDNGWHPHIHAIWFFDTDEDALDLSIAIQKIVMEQWEAQVLTCCNRKVSRKHGFLCEPVVLEDDEEEKTAATLAAYTAKRISSYATDPDKSGAESKTPFSFLVSESHKLYPKYSRIFYDYYRGQKGVRRIRMSPHFRADYGIEKAEYKAPTQNKIATAQTHQIAFLGDIANWQKFREIGRQFGDDAALDWLDEKGTAWHADSLSRYDDAASRHFAREYSSNPEKYTVLRRGYVIDFLAGKTDDAANMADYEARARHLALVEHERIEKMFRTEEEERALDARVSSSHKRYMARLDSMEAYNLTLPEDAIPPSGLGRALSVADIVLPREEMPINALLLQCDEPDDFDIGMELAA